MEPPSPPFEANSRNGQGETHTRPSAPHESIARMPSSPALLLLLPTFAEQHKSLTEPTPIVSVFLFCLGHNRLARQACQASGALCGYGCSQARGAFQSAPTRVIRLASSTPPPFHLLHYYLHSIETTLWPVNQFLALAPHRVCAEFSCLACRTETMPGTASHDGSS
jgi:hypothetical protein